MPLTSAIQSAMAIRHEREKREQRRLSKIRRESGRSSWEGEVSWKKNFLLISWCFPLNCLVGHRNPFFLNIVIFVCLYITLGQVKTNPVIFYLFSKIMGRVSKLNKYLMGKHQNLLIYFSLLCLLFFIAKLLYNLLCLSVRQSVTLLEKFDFLGFY